MSDATKNVKGLEGQLKSLKGNFERSQAKLRAKLHPDYKGDKLDDTIQNANRSEDAYRQGSKDLQTALNEKGEVKHRESKKNMAVAAGVGLPGLAGLGYFAQSQRNKKKD